MILSEVKKLLTEILLNYQVAEFDHLTIKEKILVKYSLKVANNLSALLAKVEQPDFLEQLQEYLRCRSEIDHPDDCNYPSQNNKHRVGHAALLHKLVPVR